MTLSSAFRRIFFALLLGLTPLPAYAFTARICNTGDADLILAVAGETGIGGWYAEGWYPVAPGKCWSRGSSWEYQFLFSLRYRDATGKMGYGNFTPSQVFGKSQLAKPSDRRLCVDLRGPFRNRGSLGTLGRCKAGQEPAPFSIHISGGTNQDFTLNIPTSKSALHEVVAPPASPESSFDLKTLESACYDLDADACMAIIKSGPSNLYWAGPRACLSGDAEGCISAARDIRDGPFQDDGARRSALRLFALGCIHGSKEACGEGEAYLGKPFGKKPDAPLLIMLGLGCDPDTSGIARQLCWHLVERLEDPTVAKGNFSEADALELAEKMRAELCETPQKGETCAAKP